MNSKDHEKISAEACHMLEPLLVEHYKKTYEESYELLRRKIQSSFRGKDINSKYRSILINDLEYLVLTVILRLISINSKSLMVKGERIRDLEAMVNKITDLVYREELKSIRKRLVEQPIDESNPASNTPPIPQSIDDEIQAIKKEIIQDCYDACVDNLSDSKKAIFRAYYRNDISDSKELIAARKRLANEVAGLTPAQSQSQTPKQEIRILNNLQSQVNKWRKSTIEDCVKKCVEVKISQHQRLNYLS
jgi:hypothetical protein